VVSVQQFSESDRLVNRFLAADKDLRPIPLRLQRCFQRLRSLGYQFGADEDLAAALLRHLAEGKVDSVVGQGGLVLQARVPALEELLVREERDLFLPVHLDRSRGLLTGSEGGEGEDATLTQAFAEQLKLVVRFQHHPGVRVLQDRRERTAHGEGGFGEGDRFAFEIQNQFASLRFVDPDHQALVQVVAVVQAIAVVHLGVSLAQDLRLVVLDEQLVHV